MIMLDVAIASCAIVVFHLTTFWLFRWYREPDPECLGADRKPSYVSLATVRNILPTGLISVLGFVVVAQYVPLIHWGVWLILFTIGTHLAMIDLLTTWIPLRGSLLAGLGLVVALVIPIFFGLPLASLLHTLVAIVVSMIIFAGMALPAKGLGLADCWYMPMVAATSTTISPFGTIFAVAAGFIFTAVGVLVISLRRWLASRRLAQSVETGEVEATYFALTPGLFVGAFLTPLVTPLLL